MPDIILGALIGSIATVLGTIIQGIISNKTTRAQITARLEENRQSYLIASRTDLLINLRQTISEWMNCSNRQLNYLVIFISDKDKQSENEFHKITNQLQDLSYKLDVLRSQVSDTSLYDLTDQVKIAMEEIDNKRLPLLRIFNTPNSGINTMEVALKEDRTLIKKAHTAIIPLNKRIEELLSGALPN